MLRLLKFAICYTGWHTYCHDVATVRAVQRLERLGLIKVNEFHQFTLNTDKPN